MFSKEESSNIKQEFWTTFGQYMAPVPSAGEEKVNWINYKTGLKDVHFKMQALKRSAITGIFLLHKDIELQELFYEQFLGNKAFLESLTTKEWSWQLHTADEGGKIISRIFTELPGVSIMNRNDWPAIISFFKQEMMLLDEFWSMARYGFEQLR